MDVTEKPARRRRLRVPRSTFARHALLGVAGLVAVVLVLELSSPFVNFQFATMSYYAIAAVGLTVLTGLNGQISLGHGALMAVGAYATALLTATEALPLVVVMLLAAAVTVAVGALVGVAAARLHGPYLAGATLALAVAVPAFAIYFDGLFGGEQGLRIDAPDVPVWFADAVYFLSANDAGTEKYLAYLGWTTLIVVMVLLADLAAGRVGRVWRAVRDDEVAAELAGIRLGRVRVLSREGRAEAAERWYSGDFGPESEMARHAPGTCATCAFFVPLAGALGARFGVCANDISPADGRVVETAQTSEQVQLRRRARPSAVRTDQAAGMGPPAWPAGRGDFRGPRCRRQRRGHQAHHREPQPADLPRGGARHADGARARPMVLSTLRRRTADPRRDRAVRPQLVQPRRGRACDGVLR